MTNKELNEWLLNKLDKISRRKDVKLNRIIYWRIFCTLIMRDIKCFKQVLIGRLRSYNRNNLKKYYFLLRCMIYFQFL
jgi:hypothetical protein